VGHTINKPLNLAFLGCGFATRLHSKTLAKFGNDVRRFYASRDANKAAEYNRKFGGNGTFDSYDAAIQSRKIDVVLVATPPVQHLDQTLLALKSGKHVIVEKPPFLRASDFAVVRKAAKAAGKRVFVAENYFYKPLALKLRELIHSGVIGDPLFMHVNALKEQRIKDWRGDLSLSGGGALFEGGIHWVNFIANLGWQIKSVSGLRPNPKTDFDKSILISIEYENGPVGSLYYSWETPSLFKGLRLSKIYGRAGSITFESNGVFMFVRGKQKQFTFPGFGDIAGYKAMFADFIKSIREDVEPQFNLDLAERDLSLVETIYASSNNK
jgi:predicted dehydrogenase